MFVDFKISSIARSHLLTRAIARIYLGDVTTEDEPDIDGVMQSVTRYRRQELLEEVVLKFPEEATQTDIEDVLVEYVKTARPYTLPIPEQRDA